MSASSASVGAVSDGTSSLHPSVLPAERRGQRGADQIVRGVPRSGQRSQALPHVAARPARDADAQDPAKAFSWYVYTQTRTHVSKTQICWCTSSLAWLWWRSHEAASQLTDPEHSVHPRTHPLFIFHCGPVTERSDLHKEALELPQQFIDSSPQLDTRNDLDLRNAALHEATSEYLNVHFGNSSYFQTSQRLYCFSDKSLPRKVELGQQQRLLSGLYVLKNKLST